MIATHKTATGTAAAENRTIFNNKTVQKQLTNVVGWAERGRERGKGSLHAGTLLSAIES